MFIRSERLFLRPGWPEDQSDLAAMLHDEGLARHVSRMPWHDDGQGRDASRHPRLLITLPDRLGAQVVGMVGFAPCDGQTELGVWIGRAWWNMGFATEAVRAAFGIMRTLGHCRLVASHFADSPAVGRMLAKLGFALIAQQHTTHGQADIHLLTLCPPASDPANFVLLRNAA